jgi:hypothetical protein
MQPNLDLPPRQCNRPNLHNPHEWQEDETVAGPGMSIGTSYRCDGVWNLPPRGLTRPTTPDPDPDSELDTLLLCQPTGPIEPAMTELIQWWTALASADLAELTPKAAEYSAHDLRLTGHLMADLISAGPVDDTTAAEITCMIYALSKITRALGAYKEGRRPSDDTITDIRIYATMVARIRAVGGWPWPK